MRLLILIIILAFIKIDLIDAQKYRLIESKQFPDNSKDCRKIGDCISDKYIRDDTLHLTIFFNNNCRDLSKFQDSFNFKCDTLRLYLIDTTITKYFTVYNKEKNIIDSSRIIMQDFSECWGGYDIERIEYKFIGFKNLPKVFQFNYSTINDCPTRPLLFDIYNNDSINMINSNGYPHGKWISFYDSGEIFERKYYDNGVFISGTTFDKSGNDLHYIDESSGSIQNVHVEIKK